MQCSVRLSVVSASTQAFLNKPLAASIPTVVNWFQRVFPSLLDWTVFTDKFTETRMCKRIHVRGGIFFIIVVWLEQNFDSGMVWGPSEHYHMDGHQPVQNDQPFPSICIIVLACNLHRKMRQTICYNGGDMRLHFCRWQSTAYHRQIGRRASFASLAHPSCFCSPELN